MTPKRTTASAWSSAAGESTRMPCTSTCAPPRSSTTGRAPHINLGIALARTGQVDWAIRAFEQATQIAPDEGSSAPLPGAALPRPEAGPRPRPSPRRRDAALPETRRPGRRGAPGLIPFPPHNFLFPVPLDSTENAVPITVVSGLPRSGTSLMMQMLAAGGIPPLTDEQRAADPSNPRGYLELEAVKRLKMDRSWLPRARGKAVKIIHLLLPELASAPPDENGSPLSYRVILMRRPIAEIVRSQRAMLSRQGKASATVPDAQLEQLFTDQLARVERWLADRPEFQVFPVWYPELVAHPAETAARVNAFLGGGLDEAAMIRAVDPSLYREVAAGQQPPRA